MMASALSPRFGGELLAGCDPVARSRFVEPAGCLAFSHGRGALAWLLENRGPFTSALISAYTCPIVPRLFLGRGLHVAACDVGADSQTVEATVMALPGRTLVVIPAMFGLAPTIDVVALARRLGDRACVVIDAAQTAFGHRDFPLPPGGAVLSGPRKTLAIGDGAVLRLDGLAPSEISSVAVLPTLEQLSDDKMRMRGLFAAGDQRSEAEALALARSTEGAWPDNAYRMTDKSWAALGAVDAQFHSQRRQANRARLKERLAGFVGSACDGPGTPYCHAILVPDRAVLLPRLHARRLFATPLWPDAWHDPEQHPTAAGWARELLALPVDQRYDEGDMDRMADLLRAALEQNS